MDDKFTILALVIVGLLIAALILSCNAGLCSNKGGHLTLSLLNSAGYACVDKDDRVIPLP